MRLSLKPPTYTIWQCMNLNLNESWYQKKGLIKGCIQTFPTQPPANLGQIMFCSKTSKSSSRRLASSLPWVRFWWIIGSKKMWHSKVCKWITCWVLAITCYHEVVKSTKAKRFTQVTCFLRDHNSVMKNIHSMYGKSTVPTFGWCLRLMSMSLNILYMDPVCCLPVQRIPGNYHRKKIRKAPEEDNNQKLHKLRCLVFYHVLCTGHHLTSYKHWENSGVRKRRGNYPQITGNFEKCQRKTRRKPPPFLWNFTPKPLV